MTFEITTPSKVTLEVQTENDAYLQGLKERGYEVKQKFTIHRRPFIECEACSA